MKKATTFLPMKLANALIAKRTKEDISFRSASETMGVDKMSLHRAELGDIPKLEVFHTLCFWLDMPMESFFVKPKTRKK